MPEYKYLRYWDRSKRVNTHKIKGYLIRDGLKHERCEVCGFVKWQGTKIPLSLHHKDGNRWNNNLDNLQLLCYNCHGLTDNFSKKFA